MHIEALESDGLPNLVVEMDVSLVPYTYCICWDNRKKSTAIRPLLDIISKEIV